MQSAKLPVLRRRQDGRKGHNHNAAERVKAVTRDSQSNGGRANTGRGMLKY